MCINKYIFTRKETLAVKETELTTELEFTSVKLIIIKLITYNNNDNNRISTSINTTN